VTDQCNIFLAQPINRSLHQHGFVDVVLKVNPNCNPNPKTNLKPKTNPNSNLRKTLKKLCKTLKNRWHTAGMCMGFLATGNPSPTFS